DPANVAPVAPTIAGITPGGIISAPIDQPIALQGSGFRPGLTVTVGLPGGGNATLSGTQIVDVTDASIQLLVTFADAGVYTFTVHNPDGGISPPFSIAVAPLPHFVPTWM